MTCRSIKLKIITTPPIPTSLPAPLEAQEFF